MAFEDVIFPMDIAVGLQAGPRRDIEIQTSRSGREFRNQPAADSRRRYVATVPTSVQSANDALLNHWEGRRGPLKSFPLYDPGDHKSCAATASIAATDQTIGTGDGATTAFQLVKLYESAGPNPYSRIIWHPIVAGVLVALDGVPQGSGWTVSRTTGIVTFSVAPSAAVVVTAGFQFHTTVRYDGMELLGTNIAGALNDDGTLLVEYTDVNMIEVLGE